MSWLLFLDESGHDHRIMPYEVRGGLALRVEHIWPFVLAVRCLEVEAFGTALAQFKKEFKGATLLGQDRFRWANQAERFEDECRRKHARAFLAKGVDKRKPTREEFTAYGQACLEMARGLFALLREHNAVLFASAIPRGVRPPDSKRAEEYLRKDHVFLLERFFYFLEEQRDHGLLVMDRVEDEYDRQFVRRLEAYFTRTETGRYRSDLIVPSPIFVSSTMSLPIQVADVCIYSLNWGFRLPSRGMNAESRLDIAKEFAPWLDRLQIQGAGLQRRGGVRHLRDRVCAGPVHA